MVIGPSDLTSNWTAQTPSGEFCLWETNAKSSRYNGAGSSPQNLLARGWYDSMLGGLVPFSRIVENVQAGGTSACAGFARQFIAQGGVL